MAGVTKTRVPVVLDGRAAQAVGGDVEQDAGVQREHGAGEPGRSRESPGVPGEQQTGVQQGETGDGAGDHHDPGDLVGTQEKEVEVDGQHRQVGQGDGQAPERASQESQGADEQADPAEHQQRVAQRAEPATVVAGGGRAAQDQGIEAQGHGQGPQQPPADARVGPVHPELQGDGHDLGEAGQAEHEGQGADIERHGSPDRCGG